jgi:hypothetical protein
MGGTVLTTSYRSMSLGLRMLFVKRGEGTCFSRPMSTRAFSRQISSLCLSTLRRRRLVSVLDSLQISSKHSHSHAFLIFAPYLPSSSLHPPFPGIWPSECLRQTLTLSALRLLLHVTVTLSSQLAESRPSPLRPRSLSRSLLCHVVRPSP